MVMKSNDDLYFTDVYGSEKETSGQGNLTKRPHRRRT